MSLAHFLAQLSRPVQIPCSDMAMVFPNPTHQEMFSYMRSSYHISKGLTQSFCGNEQEPVVCATIVQHLCNILSPLKSATRLEYRYGWLPASAADLCNRVLLIIPHQLRHVHQEPCFVRWVPEASPFWEFSSEVFTADGTRILLAVVS